VSPIAEEHDTRFSAQQQPVDNESAIALTPIMSRNDEEGHDIPPRKRSMSVQSQLGPLDIRRSPAQMRSGVFEKPRQASGSSFALVDATGAPGGRKKKNLVSKMERWWTSVKKNILQEGQERLPVGMTSTPSYRYRIPSAPTSRRGSEIVPRDDVESRHVLSIPMREGSSHSLRQTASVSELRRTPSYTAAVPLVSDELSRQSSREDRSNAVPRMSLLPVYGRKPSIVPEEPSALPTRPSSSLDVRRRQPSLRLELELPSLGGRIADASGSSGDRPRSRSSLGQSPKSLPPPSSAHSQQEGGLQGWRLTPSAIVPLSAAALSSATSALTPLTEGRDHAPIAPGAGITLNSVREHVKHRLNAAKAQCDHFLRRTIDAMTKYAEEQKSVEILEDRPRDYFDVVADSPVLDDNDSDFEGGDRQSGWRSRNLSSSRTHSRRPSLSMGSASPQRRISALPASPNRVRQRSSVAQRGFGTRESRLSRHASLSLEKTFSAPSSRSTSRSCSPLPPSQSHLTVNLESVEDGPKLLHALQDLIVLATDVMDLSVNYLVSRPSACTEIIQNLQKAGQVWDDHEEWPGRDWYVDILMAVANFSRVLDWWEAEKGFWNFENDGSTEPLMFVLRPPRDDPEARAPHLMDSMAESPSISSLQMPPLSAVSPLVLNREIHPPIPASDAGEEASSSKAQAVEDLRFLAEHAKMVNIVMELSLQGEEILYVNDAIMEVIG
jgi:serine/threonine-protein kinase RIM15